MERRLIDRSFHLDDGDHRFRRHDDYTTYPKERSIPVGIVNQNIALLGQTALFVDDKALLDADRPRQVIV
ncbi:hypothetical protein D3C76_1066550 [compost metagenome]